MRDRKFKISDKVIIKDKEIASHYDCEYALIIGYSSEGYQAYTFYNIEDIDNYLNSTDSFEVPRILNDDEIRIYEHISDCPTSMLYFMTGMDWISNFLEPDMQNKRYADPIDNQLYKELKEKENV